MSDKNERTIPRAAYSVEEFREAVPISASKFYSEVAAGRIRTVKVGRRRLVPADEPANYLATLRRAASRDKPR